MADDRDARIAQLEAEVYRLQQRESTLAANRPLTIAVRSAAVTSARISPASWARASSFASARR